MVTKTIRINFLVGQRFFQIISENADLKNVTDLGNGSTEITVEIASDAAANNLKQGLINALIEVL